MKFLIFTILMFIYCGLAYGGVAEGNGCVESCKDQTGAANIICYESCNKNYPPNDMFLKYDSK